MSYRIDAALFGDHRSPNEHEVSSVTIKEERDVWNSYVDTLKYLIAKRKQVVLVLQAPELPADIGRLIMFTSHGASKIDGYSRDWWARRNSFVMSHISDIPKEVKIVDPSDYFCDENNCFAGKDGSSYYFDDNHMSVFGASIIARPIFSLLQAESIF